MKQILLAAAFFALLLFISCNEKDGNSSYTGIWVANELEISNCQDDARNGSELLNCDEASCFRLALNGDGSYTFQQGFLQTRGNWSRDGRDLFLCLEDEGEVSCSKYLAVLTNESLVVSTDSTTAGCITTYNFNREEQTDSTTVQ